MANETGDEGGEDGEAKMLGDEGGVVREERGVEFPKDARDVQAAVFGEGVVAVDKQDEERERGEQQKPARGRPGRRSAVVCSDGVHY